MTDDRIVRETIVRESVFERHAGRAVDQPLHQGDVVEFLMRNAGAQLVYQRNLISPASVQMIPVSRQVVDLMALTSPGYEPIATATTTMPGFRR